jgi:hypothetical protein
MWLIQNMRAYAGWALSICDRLIRIAPFSLAIIVVATLVSRVSHLLAFFLPLKLIILVGSPHVPSYFPASFQAVEREVLVAALGAATVVIYFVHLIADKIIDIFSERTGDLVLAEADKLPLFANQDDMVHKACRRFADTLAATIFVALVIVLIGYLHPSVGFVVVGWASTWFAVAAIGGAFIAGFRQWLEANGTQYVSKASSTGFFAITTLIVVEFLSGASFHILFAIISLILGRQTFQSLARIVNNAIALYPIKLQINSLFFRGHVWQGALNAEGKGVWDLLGKGEPEKWLPATLTAATGDTIDAARMDVWHQTGQTDVLVFDVRADGADGESRYFVKLFGAGRVNAAVHEAALLKALPDGQLPAQEFLGSANVEGMTCIVYRRGKGRVPTAREWGSDLAEIKGRCWACELPRDMVQRFRRSHRLLPQRLSSMKIERLELVASSEAERHDVERLRMLHQPLIDWLERMPLALHNPDIAIDKAKHRKEEPPVATHWARWALEPIGVGWSTGKRDRARAKEWLDHAGKARADLAGLSVDAVWLVALLSDFERTFAAQKYRTAIKMLKGIGVVFDELTKSAEKPIDAPEPARHSAPVPRASDPVAAEISTAA